jgi:hypothetical protein
MEVLQKLILLVFLIYFRKVCNGVIYRKCFVLGMNFLILSMDEMTYVLFCSCNCTWL